MSNTNLKAKAARLTAGFSIDAISIDEVAVSAPGAGEVLVHLKAGSLNYRDLMTVKGVYDPKLPRPRVLGSDASGEVAAVGQGVTAFKPGDRVAGSFFQDWIRGPFQRRYAPSALGGGVDGTFTTARIFREDALVALPPHLTFEEGATLPCAAVTAWQALVSRARIKAGDTVLVLGTGGVSIFGLQLARAHGARVIVTSSSDEKLSRAKALGADETINYIKTPEWDGEVLARTGGEGVDIVLETGGAGTLPRSLRAVRPGGHVAIIGVLTGIEQPVNIRYILQGLLNVQGIYVGSAEMFAEMNRAIAATRLKPVIDKTFPLEQIGEALRYLESAGHFGKIVLTFPA